MSFWTENEKQNRGRKPTKKALLPEFQDLVPNTTAFDSEYLTATPSQFKLRFTRDWVERAAKIPREILADPLEGSEEQVSALAEDDTESFPPPLDHYKKQKPANINKPPPETKNQPPVEVPPAPEKSVAQEPATQPRDEVRLVQALKLSTTDEKRKAKVRARPPSTGSKADDSESSKKSSYNESDEKPKKALKKRNLSQPQKPFAAKGHTRNRRDNNNSFGAPRKDPGNLTAASRRSLLIKSRLPPKKKGSNPRTKAKLGVGHKTRVSIPSDSSDSNPEELHDPPPQDTQLVYKQQERATKGRKQKLGVKSSIFKPQQDRKSKLLHEKQKRKTQAKDRNRKTLVRAVSKSSSEFLPLVYKPIIVGAATKGAEAVLNLYDKHSITSSGTEKSAEISQRHPKKKKEPNLYYGKLHEGSRLITPLADFNERSPPPPRADPDNVTHAEGKDTSIEPVTDLNVKREYETGDGDDQFEEKPEPSPTQQQQPRSPVEYDDGFRSLLRVQPEEPLLSDDCSFPEMKHFVNKVKPSLAKSTRLNWKNKPKPVHLYFESKIMPRRESLILPIVPLHPHEQKLRELYEENDQETHLKEVTRPDFRHWSELDLDAVRRRVNDFSVRSTRGWDGEELEERIKESSVLRQQQPRRRSRKRHFGYQKYKNL